MPDPISDAFGAIQAGLAQIPDIVLVLGLLIGPTLAWIGFRLYAAPKTKPVETPHENLFWICGECRSANEVSHHRCYHCRTDRDAVPGALRVLDEDQFLEIDLVDADGDPDLVTYPGIAVGPGKVLVEPEPALVPTVAATSLGERPAETPSSAPPPDPEDLKPVARRPRKAVVAGRGSADERDAAD